MKKLLVLSLLSSYLFAGEVQLKVTNINSNKGKIGIAIFQDRYASSFPAKHEHAYLRDFVDLKDLPLKLDLPNGTYAITLFHDLNENSDLDTNALGIPTEPFGFSNDPKLLFGPPSFSKASFKVNNSTKLISIKLKTF